MKEEEEQKTTYKIGHEHYKFGEISTFPPIIREN
jgi:hypothetical protein